jgi:hypothetical protein
MTQDEYNEYLDDWNKLIESEEIKNRLDYLKYYNIKDTIIMIPAINWIIEENSKYGIDTLKHMSISSIESTIKYCMCYSDFNPKTDYPLNNITKIYIPSNKFILKLLFGYSEQDKKAFEREQKERDPKII